MVWGKHAVLNLFKCRGYLIRSPSNIADFSRTLVQRIDMVAYGPPQIQHFGTGNKAGYTLVQLIETSNITGHFCDESGDAYLDVFSCKDFDPKVVEDVCRQYFQPQNVDMVVLERQAMAKRNGWDYP